MKHLSYSLNYFQPTKYKQLYFRTLSKNHIIDLSDKTVRLQVDFLEYGVIRTITESTKSPYLESVNLEETTHHLK
ncbi:hypothetical protein CU098_008936, partial [Rhizopus stolonifer]